MSPKTITSPAERAARARQAQGLPLTISDRSTLDKVAEQLVKHEPRAVAK